MWTVVVSAQNQPMVRECSAIRLGELKRETSANKELVMELKIAGLLLAVDGILVEIGKRLA